MRLLTTFVFLILGATKAWAWSPNDVSVLLPLPLFTQMHQMLAPFSQGQGGELLPESIYQLFDPMEDGVVPKEIYEQNLKVVGIRIDPCFTEGVNPPPCRRQIRLVWQPLMESTAVPKRPTPFSLDAAIHSFYELDKSEWERFLKEWRRFSSGSAFDSLGPNPKLSQEGYDSNYWKQMRKTILKFCGKRNLSRATVMTVKTENNRRVWNFRGFDIENGKVIPIPIARVNSDRQSFSFSLEDLNLSRFKEGNVSPDPREGELSPVFANSEDFARFQTEESSMALAKQIIGFENPNKHNPGTLDCVSCHMAQTTRLWGERNLKINWWADELKEARFQSPLNLKNNSVHPENTNRMRAFGYFARDPILSQRVINETAVVTEYLNRISKLETP